MTIGFSTTSREGEIPLVIPVVAGNGENTFAALADQDPAIKDAIARAMTVAGFQGEADRLLTLVAPVQNGLRLVTLAGIGPAETITPQSLRSLGGAIAHHLRAHKHDRADVILAPLAGIKRNLVDMALDLAMGASLSGYSFHRHKTQANAASPLDLCFCLPDARLAHEAISRLESLTRAVWLARDLTNEPANMLSPTGFAARCREMTRNGLVVDVLDQAALKELAMGALLGVAQGSKEPPAVVVLEWKGGAGAPVVLLGKGVTFDSGGLLPKGPEEMWDMKNDMAGAAAVVAVMGSLAERGVPVHAVGIIGLVENMPSGHALRPGDVVRSLSGKTIEVLHTDAEGRLVLADLITYAQQRYDPRALIDIATLTGAMTAVLGQEYAGLFSNNDSLAAQLSRAADSSGEKVWRLPLCDAFDKMLESSVADVQNITKQRMAGSATAAQFLSRFVNNVPWAHLDICGTAWRKDKDPYGVPGATGYGVLLLNDFFEQTIN